MTFYFSNSQYFTATNNFSGTDNFNMTLTFSKSDCFSSTSSFTGTNSFFYTETLKPQNPIQIEIKSDETHKISTGIKIGIGIAAGTAVLAAIIVGVIFMRKRKTKIEDFNEETFEISNSKTMPLLSQNPLNDIMLEDDPFEDEFD